MAMGERRTSPGLLAQRRARAPILARLRPETVEALAPRRDQERLRWIAVAAMIAALLGGGLIAATGFESVFESRSRFR
jgi:hypothetical protein